MTRRLPIPVRSPLPDDERLTASIVGSNALILVGIGLAGVLLILAAMVEGWGGDDGASLDVARLLSGEGR